MQNRINPALQKKVKIVEVLNRRPAEATGPERRTPDRPDTASEAHELFPNSLVIGLGNPVARGKDHRGRSRRQGRAGGSREPPTSTTPTRQRQTAPMAVSTPRRSPSRWMPPTLQPQTRDDRYPDRSQPEDDRPPDRPTARGAAPTAREAEDLLADPHLHGDALTAEADGLVNEVAPAQSLSIAEGNPNRADPGMSAAIRAEMLRMGPVLDFQPAGVQLRPVTGPASDRRRSRDAVPSVRWWWQRMGSNRWAWAPDSAEPPIDVACGDRPARTVRFSCSPPCRPPACSG